MIKLAVFLFFLILLSSCAGPVTRVPYPEYYARDDKAAQDCLRTYAALDSYLYVKGKRDAQDSRVEGYPFLRVSRFLSSFRDELQDPARISQWLGQMSQLDIEARTAEVHNISESGIKSLFPGQGRDSLIKRLRQCASILVTLVIRNEKSINDISQKAVVPDDYSTLKRTLGIYPITSIFFMQGIRNLHEETIQRFKVPVKERLRGGRYITYAPREKNGSNRIDNLEQMFSTATANPLGIPEFDSETLEKIYMHHAPVWEVGTLASSDYPGEPSFSDTDITIDTSTHITYTYHSYIRFYDQIYLQLNYVIWFPARPLTGPLDLLGGHIDGITWRVTLDHAGRALFYDTIHNCGCYHMALPDIRVEYKGSAENFIEPILVPANAPRSDDDQRIFITLEPGTHYIQHVRSDTADRIDKFYQMQDYHVLKSLPWDNNNRQRRSMFNENGLVTGTERRERWLFWPMGIDNPGAMRERGRHAIAFVGRRHFDDPYIFEENFIYKSR